LARKKVVVKGGGSNLYYISENSGTFYVYKGGGWSETEIGKTKTMEDALALIKSHSGRDVESIG